jgi:hypothetical protein
MFREFTIVLEKLKIQKSKSHLTGRIKNSATKTRV